jgi:hypothetical protein
MIKTIQQTWNITYCTDPIPSICITRKEGDVTINRHDFNLDAAKELVEELQAAIIEAEGA